MPNTQNDGLINGFAQPYAQQARDKKTYFARCYVMIYAMLKSLFTITDPI